MTMVWTCPPPSAMNLPGKIRVDATAGNARPITIDRPTMTVNPRKDANFLNTLYQTAASNQPRQAAASVMKKIDELLLAGAFEECKRLLEDVDVARLRKQPTILLAFLGITLAAKEKLAPSRGTFFNRAAANLRAEFGPERAERILKSFQ